MSATIYGWEIVAPWPIGAGWSSYALARRFAGQTMRAGRRRWGTGLYSDHRIGIEDTTEGGKVTKPREQPSTRVWGRSGIEEFAVTITGKRRTMQVGGANDEGHRSIGDPASPRPCRGHTRYPHGPSQSLDWPQR